MIRKYGLGLGKLLFTFAQEYAELNLIRERIIGSEQVEPNLKVNVVQYIGDNGFKIRLIGNNLVIKSFVELEGKKTNIAQAIINMRKNGVRMRLIN